MEKMKIKDVFNLTDKAIFKTFVELFPNVLTRYELDVSVLDNDFLYNYGQRNINSFIYNLLDENFDISQDNLRILCKILNNHFGSKWEQLIYVDNKQYDFLNIDNYEKTNNHITQQNTKVLNTQTNQENVNNNIYGFNSNGSVPQSESFGNQISNSTKSSDLMNNTKNLDEKEIFEGRRGVKPQDLVESERKKLKYDTLITIYNDVCNIISLSIY